MRRAYPLIRPHRDRRGVHKTFPTQLPAVRTGVSGPDDRERSPTERPRRRTKLRWTYVQDVGQTARPYNGTYAGDRARFLADLLLEDGVEDAFGSFELVYVIDGGSAGSEGLPECPAAPALPR